MVRGKSEKNNIETKSFEYEVAPPVGAWIETP
jgi:hypothetical protein